MAVQLGGVVNGTPQYFELADAPSVDLPAGSSLTMGVWMKVDAFDGAASNYIYSHGAYGVNPSANWIIYHENGGPTAGRMELRLSTQGAGVWQANRQNDMLDGTWTLVLLEKSGGNTWRFFKAKPGEQPVQFFTVTSTFIPGDPTSVMRIGCPSVPADDTIRDARLWRGGLWRFFILGSALTDAEKLQLAQGKDLITDLGKTPDLYLRMDTDTVTDASANARAVTKVGSPTTISNPIFLNASNPISVTEPANRTVHQRRNGYCDVPIAGQTFLETRAMEARAINAVTNVPATNWTPITSITKAGAFSGVLRVPQGGWYKTQVRRREDTSKVATSSNVWGVGDVIVLYGQSQMQHTWSNYLSDVTIPPLGSMMLPTTAGYWTSVTGKGAQAFLDAVIAKTGMPTAIIAAAIGGRTIAQLSKGGQHYTDLINMCKAVTNGPAAVFWHQGGDDVVAGTTRDTYLAALRKLLTDLRTDLSNPFRFGVAVLSNRTSGTDATIDAIRDAHYDFLYSDPDTVWLGTNPDMVLADAVHYSVASQTKYSKRMALAALKALHYQDFDARGPSIGAVTVADNVVTININHDKGTDLGTFGGTLPPNEIEILVAGTPVTPTAWKLESSRIIATLPSAPNGVVTVRNAYGYMNTNTNMVRDNLVFLGEPGLPLQPTRDDVVAKVIAATGSKVAYFVELAPTSTSNAVLLPLLDQSLEAKLNTIASQDPANTSLIDYTIEQFYLQNKSAIRSITVNRGSELYAVYSSDGLRKGTDTGGGDVVLEATGDGVADDTQAFLDALAANSVVKVPKPKAFYRITKPITVPAGKHLIGEGQPLVKYFGTQSGGVGVFQSGGAGAVIKGIDIDGGSTNTPQPAWPTYGVKVTHDSVTVQDVNIVNHRAAGFFFQGANYSKVKGGGATNGGAGPGISVQQCTRCEFVDVDVSRNLTNFGCYVFESHYNLFDGLKALNKGTGNVSLELIGITYSCSHNKIMRCRAEGTGDNGISVTGTDNEIIGNHAEECKHSGIYLYGSRNTAVGNHCENNNQRYTGDNTAKFAGITVQSSWGGLGSYNTVTGNVCIDTQTVKTQYAGVRLANHSYGTYAANTAYTTNSYVANGLNVYKCVRAGTSAVGGVSPTHTSGDVTDGTVIWRFVTTGDTNLNPKYNMVGFNTSLGNLNAGVFNETTNAANTVVDAGNIELAAAGSPTVSTKILAGNFSPSSPGTPAPIGSIFLRNGGGTGITAYLKDEAGDTKWVALVTRKSGTTANRPTISGVGYMGYMFFDETLGKPIWYKWTGSSGVWVDAAGTTV